MALASTQVTVDSTADLIVKAHSADSGSGIASVIPTTVVLKNSSADTSVFIGGSDVTTANGFELSPGEFSPPIELNGDSVYGVTSAGSAVVHVLAVD